MMKIYSNKKIYFIKQSLSDFCELFTTNDFSNFFLKENQINAIFIRSNEKITHQLLDGTNVEFIATATSGIDHIESGIQHYYAPGSNANSVAEYVIFSLCKYLNIISEKTTNKRIGIIGYGNIGSLVAYYCHQLGFQIFVNDPPLKDIRYDFPKYITYSEIEDIFENCHIITNHVPLTKSGNYPTFNLIDRYLLKLIPENSLFIHTSRGSIVNQNDLTQEFNNKKVFLAIDVWENEPYFDLELVKMAMLATPHVAGYSYDGKIKASKQVLQHFANHFGIDVDFTILNKELAKNKSISINDFKNIHELCNALDNVRKFSEDNIDFSKFEINDKDQIKSYFIEFRTNYPNRSEVLMLPSETEIIH